jgi:mRNA-degrading endonuclease YafQ of YafQ-DinJ toxin-antitoxin module
MFVDEPFHPTLKTHKLSGKLEGAWSFIIDYDCRVIFYFTAEKPPSYIFFDKKAPHKNERLYLLNH